MLSSESRTIREPSSFEEIYLQAAAQLRTAGIEEPEREAQLILSLLLKKDLTWLIARFKETPPLEFDHQCFEDWILRRSQGEPIAYLSGEKEFYFRSFLVHPGVLIPRPETEHLIEWTKEDHLALPFSQGVDLCTGSGCIGLTLHQELNIPFHLVDIADEAVSCAQKNSLSLDEGKETHIHQLDILRDLPAKLPKVDLIVMNPPYIPHHELSSLSRDVREYEPLLALDGGEETGLEFLAKALPELEKIAAPHATLYIELGHNHQEILSTCPTGAWKVEGWRSDLAGISRILKLTLR